MKQVEFFNWLLPPDAWNKKPHLSRWKMSREQAAKGYPGAVPDLLSVEVRDIPEEGEYVETDRNKPWAGLWPTVGDPGPR